MCAAIVAVDSFPNRREFCSVDMSAAGTAFLFGAGIYCGTYLLGTNFIYRLNVSAALRSAATGLANPKA
jgi:hypothetical protein